MLRSFPVVSLIAAAFVASMSSGLADTYTGTFTNSSSKQWIAWHVECPGKNSTPDFSSVVVYNTASPSQKWAVYFFEQGTNYYQNNGFLAYPPEGADAQIDPGETLSVTFNYTLNTPPASFTQYEVPWPLDGAMVTVSPENMQGWSIVTNQGGRAGIHTYGAAVWEANRGLITECENHHLGRGAYYAELDYSGAPGGSVTPATAWLGLDTFNGQPLAGIELNRIKGMKYFGFVSKIPTWTKHPNYWDSYSGWWLYPANPITLQLTAESPDGADRRQFWFTPWGLRAKGDGCGRNCKRWIFYDCVYRQPYVQTDGRWYCYRPVFGEEEEFTTWAGLIAKYGNYKLVATSNDPWPAGYKSAGWDNATNPPGSHTCTATGKCLNFEIGARKSSAQLFFEEGPINWAGGYIGFSGNLDFFTLGIDLNGDGDASDSGELMTYDFEPSPTEPDVTIVAMNAKSEYDKIIGTPRYESAYELKSCGDAMDYYPTRIFGKVVKKSNVYFELDDGSGYPPGTGTRVWLIRNIDSYYDGASGYTWPNLGQWWTVWGWLEKVRFFPATPKPYALWASYFNCKRIL